MKVRVVAYKDRIVIVPNEPEKDISKDKKNLWWPTGGPKGYILGCVIGNTKEQLGVSKEALSLMERIENNHDAVGDIDWWKVDDGTYAFSWWGPIHRIINPDTAEAARGFRLNPSVVAACTIIPNDVPEEAKKVLDTEEDPVFWKEPHSIQYDEEGKVQ